MEAYVPDEHRYDGRMPYRRCGTSGLRFPEISLGCWHNFGGDNPTAIQRRMLYTAFDQGITHFDLANNYGSPFGSAETNVGQILKSLPRDELIISSKAGYLMWPGPYGEWGSRKYLLASLDQSLRRLDLDYVDLFYSHRFDSGTPLEETLGALQTAVEQGKALYVGISSYNSEQTQQAAEIMRQNQWSRILIHQPNYSMFNRWVEKKLLATAAELGVGVIAFCPLYQGLLTDKYLEGVPDSSRASLQPGLLRPSELADPIIAVVAQLNEVARARGQSLAQMAIAWILRDPRITSVVVGVSRPRQIAANCRAVANKSFSEDELTRIDAILSQVTMPESLWAGD